MTTGRLAVIAALCAACLPAGPASALEPRFDHRDEHGPFLETLVAYDTVAISGRPTASSWRPALRLAYGFDVAGEGNELILGVQGALRSWDDPAREHVNLALDVRYRAYFGTEELKTFFDAGVWVPVRSRLAAGPMIGVGIAYDFSRTSGVYAAGGFGTAFGEARIATFSASIGAQLRFE
ncbi:hypothetical protein [Anaeromyxobacter oryzae]|uniref:Outer membrane protein beta-barrel domain-containing protein n=1 Tax=Anaeromyxobacter oryzae TaxID=2918170 RepID=A0ABM7X3M2_9BACT|nr:hypothetical protein [Anaeromyxobacter oryzae]BDG06393.1 hypothetical protein AMOR_53890 [Anaeromyxobacter oryzae]